MTGQPKTTWMRVALSIDDQELRHGANPFQCMQ